MKQLLIIICLVILTLPLCYGQGKLGKAEKGLSKNTTTTSRYNQNTSSGSSYNSSNDNLFGVFGRLIIEVGLYATYYGLIETPVEQENRASKSFITKYPYYNSQKGNYAYESGTDTNLSRITISNRFIAENSELYGNHLNAEFRFWKRISIEADYLQLWENNTFFGYNTLATYTVLGKYHRIRTELFDAYWGIGATYVAGDVNELGFTYGLGAEYFFAKPLSAELNYNQSIINTRSFDKLNILLNYHKDRYKITGGYEYLRIGGIGFSNFSVGAGVSF